MNAIHFHLLLNHVPVIGVVLGVALLVVAIARHSNELSRVALALFVILAGTSIIVFVTGEPAEELVEKLPGFSKALTERHEDAARVALVAMIVVGLFSAIGLVAFWKRALARWVAPVALALSLVATGTIGYAANLGGMIRHSEIRSGAPVFPAGDEEDARRR